jgi:exosortase
MNYPPSVCSLPERASAARGAGNTTSFPRRPATALFALSATCCIALAWSYWPALASMVSIWNREPDYSHGYLVAPLALLALWLRRKDFPRDALGVCWWGLAVVGAAMQLRFAGGVLYVESVQGWSLVLWIAGACLLLGGRAFFAWAWPAVAFLLFMVPLPFQVERALRLPLQDVATRLSCLLLQDLGRPALAEGHTILLGEHVLEVEQACSGLRIFVAVAVLACAYILIVRPAWWERLVLLTCVVPVALLTNALRIVATGLAHQHLSSAAARAAAHDWAGRLMPLVAAALFGLVLFYLGKLWKEVEVVSVRDLAQSAYRKEGTTKDAKHAKERT